MMALKKQTFQLPLFVCFDRKLFKHSNKLKKNIIAKFNEV